MVICHCQVAKAATRFFQFLWFLQNVKNPFISLYVGVDGWSLSIVYIPGDYLFFTFLLFVDDVARTHDNRRWLRINTAQPLSWDGFLLCQSPVFLSTVFVYWRGQCFVSRCFLLGFMTLIWIISLAMPYEISLKFCAISRFIY